MTAMKFLRQIVTIFVFVFAAGSAAAADNAMRAWEALRGDGHVALIRHASAPGTGDPKGYTLDDCKTQRNLSEQGRAEALALGERFRAQKVKIGMVISSQWCRCRQTAELMDIGPVEEAPTFNNAFMLHERRDELTSGARAVIAAWRGPGTLVVATHGSNILALLGFHPAQGEVIVVKPDAQADKKMRLIGRVAPNS